MFKIIIYRWSLTYDFFILTWWKSNAYSVETIFWILTFSHTSDMQFDILSALSFPPPALYPILISTSISISIPFLSLSLVPSLSLSRDARQQGTSQVRQSQIIQVKNWSSAVNWVTRIFWILYFMFSHPACLQNSYLSLLLLVRREGITWGGTQDTHPTVG